jgi:cell division protein ZapA (FtsZ GTPase activity inhibitor)
MPDPSERIHVEIFGASYSLRGGADPAAVQDLARDLDERMREIAPPGADPLKVAVLTALRLVEETRGLREGRAGTATSIGERIGALTERLEIALASARDDAPASA